MSVEITFEPAGLTGLIAEGTYLSDAVRRMGLTITTECHERGECTSCVVSVVAGAPLLSGPTEAERTMLGHERLLHDERLACQVKIERSGELIVRLNSETERSKTNQNETADVRKRFSDLTLDRKLATLIQLEALTMFEALNAVVEKPLALGEKVFDRILQQTRLTKTDDRESKRPPEHRQRKQKAPSS